jgi:hypothetical protein
LSSLPTSLEEKEEEYENSNDDKENTVVPVAGVIKRDPPLLLQIGVRRMQIQNLFYCLL